MSRSRSIIDYHQNTDRLTELTRSTLAAATRQGASAASATITADSGLSVTVRMGEIETVEHHRSKHLGVTVYFGQKTGSATTTDFEPEAIDDTVGAACRIARYTQEDQYTGLAEADRMAKAIPDLDLYHPWALDPEEATRLALETEAAALGRDPRITNSEGASVSRHEGRYVFGNTHGFIGGFSGTRHSISCGVIAEADPEKQRDHWYSASRVPQSLEPAAEIGTKAAERALKRLGSQRIATRTVPVIFAADQATRLFGSFIAAISGASLYRQASFLLDHLGKPVFAEHVCITEEPHLPAGLGSSPFDSEGVGTERRELVQDGVLEGYVLDSYAARKLGMQSTGNAGGVHNLVVKPGPHDLDGLIGTMGRGLLVTELMGMGVNIVTGDYSRGAAGFWVEGGEIQFPVQEITIAANLRDMFRGIVEIGKDVELRSAIRTGSVLIDKMTIAGD